jgi:hypothetical protein
LPPPRLSPPMPPPHTLWIIIQQKNCLNSISSQFFRISFFSGGFGSSSCHVSSGSSVSRFHFFLHITNIGFWTKSEGNRIGLLLQLWIAHYLQLQIFSSYRAHNPMYNF